MESPDSSENTSLLYYCNRLSVYNLSTKIIAVIFMMLLYMYLYNFCVKHWYGVKQESSNQYLSMFLCLRIYTMISKRTMCCYILLCVLFLHSVIDQIFCFKLELKSAFFKIMFRNNSSHNKPQIFFVISILVDVLLSKFHSC